MLRRKDIDLHLPAFISNLLLRHHSPKRSRSLCNSWQSPMHFIVIKIFRSSALSVSQHTYIFEDVQCPVNIQHEEYWSHVTPLRSPIESIRTNSLPIASDMTGRMTGVILSNTIFSNNFGMADKIYIPR
jgi:hypothetical protein